MGNTLANSNPVSGLSTLGRSQKSNQSSTRQEGSRILFLLYLIHRTWNVVVDSVDAKNKKWRSNRSTSEDSGAPESFIDSCFETDPNFSDESTLYGSQYSFCSCQYCYESKHNAYYSSAGIRMSICESELSSFCIGYQMAPSACQNSRGTQICSPKMMMDTSVSWPPNYTSKENQRPPVYNAEDYVLSLKKFSKRQQNGNGKSIYDANAAETNDKTQQKQQETTTYRSHTLPTKSSDYKNPILHAPESDTEMTLRQFGSITDLLTKLRSDLRASFPSFVQEFVSSPLDGVSLLLEVLRAIQLSQIMNNSTNNQITGATTTIPRNSQSYQRRALLDELACLQCLSICCCRSPEASARLGTTPVGLLSLAAAATGQGIRARILALQLLTAACDKSSIIGSGAQKNISSGHIAVSEALSTLRLRCGEPVRFRLLVGMLNSGGGSGELQAFGLKFINTFLESAENLQIRLYLQAELFQAGFDANNMTKTISSTSPWLEKLRAEIKHFDEIKIDVEKLQLQARESERIRSQMVILERRVQILQEEKSVLTSMERRLQERCAELQREIFRLQGAQNDSCKSLDKRPVALPRHVPPSNKQNSSEHEDEGISSSETGQSLSPVPILVLPHQTHTEKFNIILNEDNGNFTNHHRQKDDEALVDDVIEELDNVVNDAERQITINEISMRNKTREQEIVPVNLLPQPPRKTRSLAHLISHGVGVNGVDGSDLDASEYGLLLLHDNSRASYFEDLDYEVTEKREISQHNLHHVHHHFLHNETNHLHHHHHNQELNNNLLVSTNREILDAIMQARETEDDPTMNALRANSAIEKETIEQTVNSSKAPTVPPPPPPPQHFNGVFFMTEMNTPQKYPKPDIAAALQARRVSKNLEKIQSYGLDSMADIVMSSVGGPIRSTENLTNKQIYFGSNPTLKISSIHNGSASHINNVGIIRHSTAATKAATTKTASAINRIRSSHTGSKLTDIPSGLY